MNQDVSSLVAQAREGRPRAVARLISLVEGASPQLREVMAALAPLTGNAYVIGLTGPPGVGKSTTTSALVGAYRRQGRMGGGARGRPVLAVLRRGAARGPGPDVGPRVRRRGLHPVDGDPRASRWPRLGRAAGDPGTGRRRVRRDPGGDRRGRPVRGRDRGAGRHQCGAARARDGRRYPGREGGHPGDRRRVRGEQGRPGRGGRDGPGAEPHARARGGPAARGLASADRADRRVPGEGIDEVVAALEKHKGWMDGRGCWSTGGGSGPRRRSR